MPPWWQEGYRAKVEGELTRLQGQHGSEWWHRWRWPQQEDEEQWQESWDEWDQWWEEEEAEGGWNQAWGQQQREAHGSGWGRPRSASRSRGPPKGKDRARARSQSRGGKGWRDPPKRKGDDMKEPKPLPVGGLELPAAMRKPGERLKKGGLQQPQVIFRVPWHLDDLDPLVWSPLACTCFLLGGHAAFCEVAEGWEVADGQRWQRVGRGGRSGREVAEERDGHWCFAFVGRRSKGGVCVCKEWPQRVGELGQDHLRCGPDPPPGAAKAVRALVVFAVCSAPPPSRTPSGPWQPPSQHWCAYCGVYPLWLALFPAHAQACLSSLLSPVPPLPLSDCEQQWGGGGVVAGEWGPQCASGVSLC